MTTRDITPVTRRRRRLYQDRPEQPSSEPGPQESATSEQIVSEASPPEGATEVRTERLARAERIVQSHMKWAMGLGLIPIPLLDMMALIGTQVAMLTELGANYEIPLEEIRQKSLLTAAVSGFVTQSLAARSFCYLLWWVPALGVLLGPLTFSGLAGACTYAVGHVFIRHFENGGTLVDFQPQEAQEHFDEQLEQGKGEARRLNQ